METHPPTSCAKWSDPLLAGATACAAYAFLREGILNNTGIAFLVCAAVLIVMAAAEICRAPWRKLPRPQAPFSTTLKNAAVSFTGLMAGFFPSMLAWWWLRHHGAESNGYFFKTFFTIWPWLLPAIAGYVLFTEWRLGPAEDAAWHMGLMVLGRWNKVDWQSVRNGFMGWLVRVIFLPFNFTGVVIFIGRLRGHETAMLASWPEGEYYLLSALQGLLAAVIVPGYFFSSRLLGTGIRKVDFTFTGWLVTMSCYPPLLGPVFMQWLNFFPQEENVKWAAPWAYELQNFPTLALAAGAVVLVFECMHYWGEASFHLRASNLSNRGIITNGLYRYFRHPIYFAKCVMWFLWMPFLAGGTVLECAWLTLMWAGCCGIYYGRALAEERLLSTDPDYIAYATWMDEHGFFSPLGKRIPFLQFGWRNERWWK